MFPHRSEYPVVANGSKCRFEDAKAQVINAFCLLTVGRLASKKQEDANHESYQTLCDEIVTTETDDRVNNRTQVDPM
jgi:hypothetical protein